MKIHQGEALWETKHTPTPPNIISPQMGLRLIEINKKALPKKGKMIALCRNSWYPTGIKEEKNL
jgi:hypothetical protein